MCRVANYRRPPVWTILANVAIIDVFYRTAKKCDPVYNDGDDGEDGDDGDHDDHGDDGEDVDGGDDDDDTHSLERYLSL